MGFKREILEGRENNDFFHFDLVYTGGVKVQVHGGVELSDSTISSYFHGGRENKGSRGRENIFILLLPNCMSDYLSRRAKTM